VKEIKWRQWGPEAFDDARRENKPILLAISAVWCHWCHVMDHTAYSDPEVIDYVNQNFIPLRVDNDQRPDINERYNMGGWPSAAFLTPDGFIIQGATYLPPDQFLALARQTKELYDSRRADLDKLVRPAELEATPREPGIADQPEKFYQKILDDTLSTLDDMFDPVYGGFGWQPKFPNADFIRFPLFHHLVTGAENSLRMARKTLDEMGKGGICDHIEDGFFRYSTTPDWSVPHYEKMLSDNSELLSLYCDAYFLTGDESYRARAAGIVKYMLEKLHDPAAGGFRASQDADEQYYALSLDERRKRAAPKIDQRKFTDWNALAVIAMLKASSATGDPAPAHAAIKTLAYIKNKAIDSTLNVYHLHGKYNGYARDYINAAAAFLAAHEFTGDTRHLGDSIMLVQSLMGQFWDKEHGALFDVLADSTAPGYLKYRLKSVRDNARAAELFIKLHLATEDDTYGFIALHILQALYNRNKEFSQDTPAYAHAALMLTQPHFALRIAGRQGDETSKKFLATAAKLYEPRITVRFIDLHKEKTEREKLRLSETAAPIAFLCDAKSCKSRIPNPSELKDTIAKTLSAVNSAPPPKPKRPPDP
jgi:hypothetical protein